jgi:hypothetical protein
MTLTQLKQLLKRMIGTDQYVLRLNGNDIDGVAATATGLESLFQNVVVYNNTTNPTYQLDIPSGKVGIDDGSDFILVGSTLTADISASGANGLDTGSEASSTWYYIYLIKKPDGTVASLLSASATSPTLPSGYTMKRLIGAVYNNGSSNFEVFRQFGRKVMWEDDNNILSNGVGGGVTSFATVAAANFIPHAIARIGIFTCYIEGDNTDLFVSHGDKTGSSGGVQVAEGEVTGGTYAGDMSVFEMPVNSSGQIAYRLNSTANVQATRIDVYGFILTGV